MMSGAVPWSLQRGATVQPDGTVRFAVWAPHAQRIELCLLSGQRAGTHALERCHEGIFEATIANIAPGTDYWYRLDGRERPDPVSRHQPRGVHGPSRIVDPGTFRWSDEHWSGRAVADLVLYELHVGTFTEAGTFAAVIPHLAALRELGITAIELMPVAEFPGTRNWGYDGVHPYAPQSTYGGPDGLRQLVDAAHRADLAVVLDVVYNHLGPEGNYLGDFGPYFTDRYRTPWGPAVNYDGSDSDEVRRYVVDNALYWTTEFHVDGLRLDAVHAIFDFGARHILAEIADAVHAQALACGRPLLVIAESDLNDPRLVRPLTGGGYTLDAQWSDDFHHAVHVALTGEDRGYYRDFGGIRPITKAMTDRFVYDGSYSGYRRRRHGAPATDVPPQRFVVFVQNHDQVGNRAGGERLAELVPRDALRLAAAVLLLSPYVPLLFMGEEYGETNPFLYFVSHTDPALVAAVREGRRREFAAFRWHGAVPDPQAEETFLRSRIDRHRAAEPGHRELHTLYRDLLHVRQTEPALRPGAADCRATSDPGAGWIALVFSTRAAPQLLAVFNFASTVQHITMENPQQGNWTLRLATDARRYGGNDSAVPALLAGTDLDFTVPAFSALLYHAEGT